MKPRTIFSAIRSQVLVRSSPRYSNLLYIPSSNLCFFPIPKNANSYLKALVLFNSRGGERAFDPLTTTPLDYLKTSGDTFKPRSWRQVRDARTLTFAVLREPYARLVSCFVDKLVKPVVSGEARPGYFEHRLGTPEVRSFRDFVQFVCAMPDHRRERHYRSQAHFLYEFAHVKLDHVGTVETLERTIAFLRSRGLSGLPDNLHPAVLKTTRHAGPQGAAAKAAADFTEEDFRAAGIPPKEQFSDDALRALVGQAFRHDLELWQKAGSAG